MNLPSFDVMRTQSVLQLDATNVSTVLVVDDHAANIQALYRAFAPDHRVLMATDGEQALAICAAEQPDVVLLDIEMPGVDGYEVCRRLKADQRLADIPVIFVTGHSDAMTEARCLDAGAVDFISKPISPKIVRARAKTHITLKRQTDLLRALAFLDGLTGLYNRRAFEERLDAEWRRCSREGHSLAVAIIDVDHFKKFNDALGHQAGDECLRRVALSLKCGLKRPADMVARYGGEEFVCVMPSTNLSGGLAAISGLIQAVRFMAIPHPNSDVSEVVTVSSGVCAAVPDVSLLGPRLLIERADAALYEAKRQGRDRVVAGCLKRISVGRP